MVTIVTGASDGIGAEIARQLAARDGRKAVLVLAARNADKLTVLASDLKSTGAEIAVVPTDISDQAACKALIAATLDRFGSVDTLINNAGMSAHANFADVRDEHLAWYQDLMNINFWGAVWLTHAALPHLARSKGRLVAVSSVAGLIGLPGRTAYSATKFALGGFFEALRHEVAIEGVSVTVAYPGIVDTAIRRHGFDAEGRELGYDALKEEGMMPVDVCARLIVDGVAKRQREIVMTRQARLGRWIKLIAPGVTDRMAMRVVKENYRPSRPTRPRA